MKTETPEEKRVRIRGYLMKCSGTELTEFMLRNHSVAANARRDMRDALDKCIEALTDARLAAEVNEIREGLKHASTIPFPEKIKQSPPHPETSASDSALKAGDHRRRYVDAQTTEKPRQFFKR